MHILHLPFKLLTLTGIWMPEDWTQKQQKLIWVLYSMVSIGLVFMQLSSQVGYLMQSKTWAQVNERLFFIPTGISSVHKIFIFIVHRKDLISLGNMLLKEYCIPRNAEELSIQERYNEIIRVLTLACAFLVNVTMMNLVTLPLVTSGDNRTLPMRVWLPYKVDSDMSYWLSYAHQTVGIVFVGTGAVGSTLMINGFMYQVCCQFEILSSRFQNLPLIIEKFQSLKKPNQLIYRYEKRVMRQNIHHHLYIFRFAEALNNIFKSVIFQQFCLSSIVVSVSIYQLSTRPEKDLEFIMVFFYLVCVLVEFLVYSWFGNELMLESLNFQQTIYEINWTSLSTRSSRDLVLIMMRASKPIIMYCGHFIVLSLESYIGVSMYVIEEIFVNSRFNVSIYFCTQILKVSYSVFNILRMSEE
ncbi:hypothetical protein TSAR_008866 [Trichomalopsis sarcophagae]|uniref:Odorant receptor n=1 Tax=Trichomalopsis sarcophagae TaxID=543379 RepID=A0A232FBQ6_9HYME|nr:hypothetical protein TSAR_008866 [Trichomalopsis sarcophagae]